MVAVLASARSENPNDYFAEEERFELPVAFTTAVFKTENPLFPQSNGSFANHPKTHQKLGHLAGLRDKRVSWLGVRDATRRDPSAMPGGSTS